jgi:uncharacterized membrane protein YccC
VVVLLIGIVSANGYAAALDRLIDTLVGGSLALLAYALWPSWSERGAPRALSVLAQRQAQYLHAILWALAGSARPSPVELRRLAREARRAKAAADDARGQSFAEPEGRRFSPATGQGIAAALSRISLATHALRSDLEDGRHAEPRPELAPFAASVDEALQLIATRLGELVPRSSRTAEALAAVLDPWRGEHPSAAALPPLRAAREGAVATLASRPSSEHLLIETDELVDALDTLGALLGIGPPTAQE